jgi:uncharacterized protein
LQRRDSTAPPLPAANGDSVLALQLNTNTSLNLFTGHGEGYVSINHKRHEQSVVVMAGEVRTDWPVTDFAALTAAHFDYFLALKPEVLLLGTGSKQHFAHPSLYRELIQARIGIEFMDTPAACRTYNILVTEDRKVIAAVLL